MKTWKIEYLLDDDGGPSDYLSKDEIRDEVATATMAVGLTIRELKIEEVQG